jgi:hypothetical protein
VYIPLLNGVVQAYSIQALDKSPWIYKSHGQVHLQPTATTDGLTWATSRGHLNVIRSADKGVRYRIETDERIAAPPTFVPPDRLFVSTTSGYVYALTERFGDLQWRFSSGETTTKPPIVMGDSVYIITDGAGIFALDLNVGQQKWSAGQVEDFLAASTDRLYCLDNIGRVMILSRATGARLATLPTLGLDVTLMNLQTDRLYIGTSTGLLQCIHESQLDWPLIHVNTLELIEPQPADVMAPEAQPQQQQPNAPANPFGEPANPFGGGANPFETPKKDGEAPKTDDARDPFGGGGNKTGEDNPFK